MKIKITFEEEDIKKLCVKATQEFVKGTVVAEFAYGPYDRKVFCEVETPEEPQETDTIWTCPNCGYEYDRSDAPWSEKQKPFCSICDPPINIGEIVPEGSKVI